MTILSGAMSAIFFIINSPQNLMKLIKVIEAFRIGSGIHLLKNIHMYMYI